MQEIWSHESSALALAGTASRLTVCMQVTTCVLTLLPLARAGKQVAP